MNNPMQDSEDEGGSSTGSNDPDKISGSLMSVSESGSELQPSTFPNSWPRLVPRELPPCSQPSSSRATESGCPGSNIFPNLRGSWLPPLVPREHPPWSQPSSSIPNSWPRLVPRELPVCGQPSSSRATDEFLFEAQVRPGDIEDEKLTLLITFGENFFEEAVTRWGQQLLLSCECHDENFSMKFKDPPVECGRLGIIGFKPFLDAHDIRPLDIYCFHPAAQPLHVNHYFVHRVERDDEDTKAGQEMLSRSKQFKVWR